MKALSLFSSAGIGELGMIANGIDVIAANELIPNRCALYKENYPDTKMFEGDIWKLKNEVIDWCKKKLGKEELFLVYATPPCQGMSTNGSGKLKSEIEAGNRPPEDERNRLIIPAIEVIKQLKPMWVLFENVPGMKDTIISVNGKPKNILNYISEQLGPEYVGDAKVLRCSDFGIPQLRRRLITVFTRDENGKKYLQKNKGSLLTDQDKTKPISLWEAISHLPTLDAKDGRNECPDFHPLHYVSVMKEEKYWWVENTPEGETAYNNQCVNPKCLHQGNPRHVDLMENGKAIASKNTPIYCEKCDSLLPRPTMIDGQTGERRLISGFHSAYRRMDRTQPARALTRNFPFEASDNKLHPIQNRVLSVYEALLIQTITDYDYSWSIKGKEVTRSLIAQAIGESVPPRLIDTLVKKIIGVSGVEIKETEQHDLFAVA